MVIQFCGVELPLAELRNMRHTCCRWCEYPRYPYSGTTGIVRRAFHNLMMNKKKFFASQHTFWYETQILNIIFDEGRRSEKTSAYRPFSPLHYCKFAMSQRALTQRIPITFQNHSTVSNERYTRIHRRSSNEANAYAGMMIDRRMTSTYWRFAPEWLAEAVLRHWCGKLIQIRTCSAMQFVIHSFDAGPHMIMLINGAHRCIDATNGRRNEKQSAQWPPSSVLHLSQINF